MRSKQWGPVFSVVLAFVLCLTLGFSWGSTPKASAMTEQDATKYAL